MTVPNLNPTGYTGIKEKNPPNLFFFQRAPTSQDLRIFDLGDLWIDKSEDPEDVYILVNKENRTATWREITELTVGTVGSLSGNGGAVVGPTASGNIDITSTPVSGLTATSNPGSNQIDLALTGAVPLQFDSDDGSPFTLTGNLLTLVGGTNVTTTQSAPNQITIDAAGASAGFNWTVDSTSPQSLSVNDGRVATTVTVTYNLPAVSSVGDTFKIVARDANGFVLSAPAGDTIRFGNQVSSSGGSLSSTDIGDILEIICVEANTQFMVSSSVGNFNIS